MRNAPALLTSAMVIAACASGPRGNDASPIKVGPPNGTLMIAGGGAFDRDFFEKFVAAAGGPDAPIVIVPTAGGQPSYTQNDGGARAFRNVGAKDVVVLHTTDKAVANSDTFVAHIRRARGVWFPGGRHYRLVDSYAGTKSEAAFHDVLVRGGVVGGSSAGASIQGSFLVRGAPSNNNAIMAHPDYLKGFAFLRGVGIDQHVVARGRLPDLADSIMPRFPDLLLISEDEGTAWVVKGDTGEIIGRSKAFVYNGRETDAGKPFLTLWPGDRYNLATRRVMSRAIDGSKLTRAFVDSLFRANVRSSQATVLVAQAGNVLANTSYNVPPQSRHQPTTTVPNFHLGQISDAIKSEFADQIDKGELSFQQLAQRIIVGPAGMTHTVVDVVNRSFASNVDNLYRFERFISVGTDMTGSMLASALTETAREPWKTDTVFGTVRQSVYGTPDGRRNAYVRFPLRRAAIIILTNGDGIDARTIAQRIAARLLP